MTPLWTHTLTSAQALSFKGRFSESLALCSKILETHSANPEALMSVGTFLLQTGFLTNAHECFTKAGELLPKDPRPIVGLANHAREAGEHEESRRLHTILLQYFPENPIIRRNALISIEYDPAVTDLDRLGQARAWGEWAMLKAGEKIPRPGMIPLKGRPLRIGYVSSDFCQHTVGLFAKEILKAHSDAVEVFAYSSGTVKDQVTKEIQAATLFKEVSSTNDAALANLIRQDRIDLLIDLSGHTAGSRLTLFARRPAPVQVSWLGYFATTGLSCMDGVLLDEWHAPSGTEAFFVESIIRLKSGRLCYSPVGFAPQEETEPPCTRKGYITFGCFNNSAKLNSGVFDVWAQILQSVPKSRLILKWRTFHDPILCRKIQEAFFLRGISQDRIEFRGFSFHVDMLKEYADIDIALDPFPFTGGLTSCEALWMGVPVITFPQTRVVSRQTFAILSAIGLPELSATTGADYVNTAISLANDIQRLKLLRQGMRERMKNSMLMDTKGHVYNIERTFITLYQEIIKNTKT